MAIGDDAASAGMDLVPGSLPANEIDTEINKTRDYIAGFAAGVRSVANGGTGANNAPDARTNLGIPGWDIYDVPGTLIIRAPDGLFAVSTALYASNPVRLDQMNAALAGKADGAAVAAALGGKLDTGGGTIGGGLQVNGNLHNPGAFAGGSGTIAYIQNSDSRITRGVSAQKYKQDIEALDPASLGDIFPEFVEYEMRPEFGGDGTTYVGYIADSLVGTDAERFVTYRDGEVEGIDFIQFLLAQVAQLNARLTQLEGHENA